MDEEIELIDDQTTELEQLRKLHKQSIESIIENKQVPKQEEQQEVQIEKVQEINKQVNKEKPKKSKRKLGIRLIRTRTWKKR